MFSFMFNEDIYRQQHTFGTPNALHTHTPVAAAAYMHTYGVHADGSVSANVWCASHTGAAQCCCLSSSSLSTSPPPPFGSLSCSLLAVLAVVAFGASSKLNTMQCWSPCVLWIARWLLPTIVLHFATACVCSAQVEDSTSYNTNTYVYVYNKFIQMYHLCTFETVVDMHQESVSFFISLSLLLISLQMLEWHYWNGIYVSIYIYIYITCPLSRNNTHTHTQIPNIDALNTFNSQPLRMQTLTHAAR